MGQGQALLHAGIDQPDEFKDAPDLACRQPPDAMCVC